MTASPDVLTAALSQIEQGFAAFALGVNSKKPVTRQGFKNATRNPDWVRRQLEAPAAGNYGITWPETARDRILALDLDNGSDGLERPWQDRLLDLITTIGPLPPTKATTTPSGGRHAFYRWPANQPIPAGDELFGFTVRWPGRGYLVGPGSTIDGVAYLAGPTQEIADLPPAWGAAALAGQSRQASPNGFITIAGPGFVLPDVIPSGRRYATVRDYVASRYNSGLGEDELWELVRTQVAPRFAVPKTEADLRADFQRVVAKMAERLGPPRRSTPERAAIPAGPLEDAALTEFVSEPIEWLWPAWLPRGVVTLMDGNPGVSKSTLVADLVARITTGRDWPDGTPGTGRVGRVMWITTEDDPGRVLRPRIEAAGGDARLVRYVTSEVVFPSGAGAFRELVVQRASEPGGLALVVLDPLFSHIDATVRTIADSEMRKGVMTPLGDASEAADISILVVRHYSKDTTASPINRGAGSLGGIVGAARALWSVTVDPTDETGDTKAVGVSKLNYARTQPPLRYRVIDRLPPGWVTGSVSGIEWLGTSPLSIDDLMGDNDRKVADSVDVLRELLEVGPLSAAEVAGKMRARGFGDTAVRRAKKVLGIEPKKTGFQGQWLWELPKDVEDVSGTPSTPLDSRVHAGAGARGGRDQTHTSSTSYTSLAPDPEAAKGVQGVQDVEGVGLPPRVRPREAATIQCLFYTEHQTQHLRGLSGFYCQICSPEGAA
jgi:hypothetical protein